MESMDYTLLGSQLSALSEGIEWPITILANASALLMESLDRINWAGFYLMCGDSLILGPFQGKPACTKIAVGKGVCGTAVQLRQTQRVEDVHAFPGHIACDSASRSELVIPICLKDQIWGVLDLDSPVPARFTQEDQHGLEAFVHRLEQLLQELNKNLFPI